jgi:hypothetical protein
MKKEKGKMKKALSLAAVTRATFGFPRFSLCIFPFSFLA